MFRTLRTLFLIAGILIISVSGVGVSASTESNARIAISGRLEYDTTLGIPHYQIQGFILLDDNPVRLQALQGVEVTVIGREITTPSIFMQRLLQVDQITANLPFSPLPAKDEQRITIPVFPDPTATVPPQPKQQISIPSPPIPFFGTSLHLLFGRLLEVNGAYVMVNDEAPDDTATAVTSYTLDLSHLVGKRIGAAAHKELLATGKPLYVIKQALILSNDLAEYIHAADSLYIAPKGELTISIRGRIIKMDQPPIIGNGRTLVGLRALTQALGASVYWDGKNQTVTVTANDRTILVQIGSNRLLLHHQGQQVTIASDIAPVIVAGRTMVPLRALAECLGLHVTWNAESRTVELQSEWAW